MRKKNDVGTPLAFVDQKCGSLEKKGFGRLANVLAKSRRVRLEERISEAWSTVQRAVVRLPRRAIREVVEPQSGMMYLRLKAISTSPRLLGPCCGWKNWNYSPALRAMEEPINPFSVIFMR